MKFKDRCIILYKTVDKKYEEQFGFKIKETSFAKVVNYLHAPKDASCLAVTRILFGLAMLFDIPDERGGATLDKRWGDPKICHFPLFSFIQGVQMPYMALVYTALWIGSLGIMLGYKYRITAPVFTVCYWYLFFIEKSYWNNHSYLFGLVSLLLTFTRADCYWSLDAAMDPEKFSPTVPYWNYFILKFQFFILYFMAGVKKGTTEWLTGYSVPNLSTHWVFTPFTLFLTVEQTDYIIVHWFIFLFDLTVAFWMMWSRTRHVAMVFCALFHLMNSRIFTIGMFPWVCLATMPLFYPFDWPKLVGNFVKLCCKIVREKINKKIHKNKPTNESKALVIATNNEDNDYDNDNEVFRKNDATYEENQIEDKGFDKISASEELKNSKIDLVDSVKGQEEEILPNKNQSPPEEKRKKKNKTHCHEEVEWNKKITTVLIITYVTMQCFLPFSHFITKGYNNWTDGLYGYSWDMMVHTWDVQSVVVKVVDNEKNNHYYIDPNVFSPNERWFKHGDMVHQYVTCLNEKIIKESKKPQKPEIIFKNISVFIDVWCSMNGRFVQRMFDPNLDLLKVHWSPFQRIPFLMPLLDEASEWRPILNKVRNEVHSWNQYSDVVFFADFPGYALEKYIPIYFDNVTLTVLEGEVAVEPEVTNLHNNQSFSLNTGHSVELESGIFHRILNIGKKPAFYMITFHNNTEKYVDNVDVKVPKHKLPVIIELENRLAKMLIFADNIFKGIYQSVFWLPIFSV